MSRSSFAAFGLSMKEHEEILIAAAEAEVEPGSAAADDDDAGTEQEEQEWKGVDDGNLRSGGRSPSSSSLVSSSMMDGGISYGLNRWMKRYVQWLDSKPLLARCVTSAVTGCVGAILTSRRCLKTTSNNVHRRQRGHTPSRSNNISKKTGIDWLEVLAFGLHGAFVAGPLSYRM